MKTSFSLSNFNQPNTPKILSTIGNYCLIIAAIGSALVLAPISTPVLTTIGTWVAFIGTVGKILTKLSGSSLNEISNTVETTNTQN